MTSEADRTRLLVSILAETVVPGDVLLFYSNGENFALCLCARRCSCSSAWLHGDHVKWMLFADGGLHEECNSLSTVVTKLR